MSTTRYEGIEFLQASGFQRVDDDHPAGQGKPGYRAVYKTLKVVPYPNISFNWSNLKVKICVQEVEVGDFKVESTLPTLVPDKVLLPEYLNKTQNGNKINIVGDINMKFVFKPDVKTIPMSGIVEMLLIVDDVKTTEIITTGRRRIAPIISILDLVIGERMIGSLLTEEKIEIFEDWHWNRNINTVSVGSESQLDMKGINKDEFNSLKITVDRYNNLSESDKKRVVLSAEWYWKSEREVDPINRFIQLWISLEALVMPNTTNIKPIRILLESLTNISEEKWKEPIGRLFGKRGKLVHGNDFKVTDAELEKLRYLVKIIQKNELLINISKEEIQKLICLFNIAKL